MWRWVSVEVEVEVLEWVVLSECECVRRSVSAAVCDVLCSVVVTAVLDTRHWCGEVESAGMEMEATV